MSTRDDLTATALLGTSRGHLDPGGFTGVAAALVAAIEKAVPGRDATTTLLDAAAALAVAHRATPPVGPAGDPALPGLAPAPARPVAGSVVAARGAHLLRNTDPVAPELLLEWLTALDERGLDLPPRLLETALTHAAAARDPRLVGAVVAVLGARGRWLAAQRTGWCTLVAHHAPPQVDPAGDLDADPVWLHGDLRERTRWWRAVRAGDAQAARTLLEAGWATLKADERSAFLGVVAESATPEDEPLLTSALTDRAASVRLDAAHALHRLPSSAFARGTVRRALDAVTVERRLLRERLVVTFPEPRDDDPFPPPPRGAGAGAHLLQHLVAVTPLDAWRTHLGREPAALVRLARDAQAEALVTGWRHAAIAQRDEAWAAALLDSPDGQDPLLDRVHLVPLVSAADQVRHATAALAGLRADDPVSVRAATSLVTAIPAPWPSTLVEVVVGALTGPVSAMPGTWANDLATRLALAVPPGPTTAQRLRDAATRTNHTPVATALLRAADLVHLRHQIRQELS